MTNTTTTYRIQPPNLELNHQSECSDGELAEGVHVFDSLEDVARGLKGWVVVDPSEAVELIAIQCDEDDLEDSGDFEGWLLPTGCGQITQRYPFNSWGDLQNWLKHSVE